jgi:hypothetical protein
LLLTFSHYFNLQGRQSHLDLLERNKGHITQLTLDFSECTTIFNHQAAQLSSEEAQENVFELMHGYCLNHIFGACYNLWSLHIVSSHLLHCNPINICTSYSIKELKLGRVYLYKDLLPELCLRHPNLVKLSIINCGFMDRHQKPIKDMNITIDIPFSALKHFDMRGSLLLPNSCNISNIYIKCSSDSGDIYYSESKPAIGENLDFEKSSLKEYDESLVEKDCFSNWIRFKSLQTFDLIEIPF